SLGLYTYVASMAHGSVTWLLWAWGIGGLIGSSAVGRFVDGTGRPREVFAVVLVLLITAMLALPLLWSVPPAVHLAFVLWGAAGWATGTPQQHVLLSVQPQAAATVVALNGSALCLGSALGAMLGGLALTNGLAAGYLPFAAAAAVALALLAQLGLIA